MKVLFIDTVHPYLENQLKLAQFECIDGTALRSEEIDAIIGEFDGLVIRSRIKLDEQRLKLATNLKFIARAGSGLENIDVVYCENNHIDCYNAPEANCKAVGEHAIGMMLALFNKFLSGNKEVRSGKWKREENRGLELGHRTVGIIGYGHNGKALAKMLSGFGTRVLAYDKYVAVASNDHVRAATLEDIYQFADVVSFHVPLTEETEYYFDDAFLRKMTNAFYLVNTSRGKVVNTDTLVRGLKNEKVLGACLDVLEYEKSSFENMDLTEDDNASMAYLIKADNVILSPHVAGWTQESLVMLSEVLANKILSKYPN